MNDTQHGIIRFHVLWYLGPDCISRTVFEGLKFGIVDCWKISPENGEAPHLFLLIHPTGSYRELI